MPRAKIIFFVLAIFLSCSLAAQSVKLRQVAMVDLPGDPGFDQVVFANGEVVVSRPAVNLIEVFDPVKRRVIARISQISDPRGIAVDDKAQRVYVALAGNNCIAMIDSHNWQVQKLIPLNHRPDKLLWVADSATLYSTSTLDRALTAIDPDGHHAATDWELDALPQDILYDSVRQTLLVSLQDRNEIGVIDRSGQIVNRFKLNASAPTGLALDSSRRRLYVAVRFAVLVLNADNGAEISRIAAPGGINTLVLDPGGTLLYASAGDGSVLAIDVFKNLVDHELPTDVKGYALGYDPGRKMLFLPGGREGRSKMVILSPVGAAKQSAPSPAASAGSNPAEQTAKK